MAREALQARLTEQATTKVNPNTRPEELLAMASHSNIVAHDSYTAGRTARTIYAWAHSEACLSQIFIQAKSHASDVPLPFSNAAWNSAWTSVSQMHRDQRPKVNDRTVRLNLKDVEAEEEYQNMSNELPAQPTRPVTPQSSHPTSTRPHAGELLTSEADLPITIPSISQEELAFLSEHFEWAVSHLEWKEAGSVMDSWQALTPPEEFLSYNTPQEDKHAEILAVISRAIEQVHTLHETSNSEPVPAISSNRSKGKGKEKEVFNTVYSAGSSRDLTLDRIASATPTSVFSTDNRLSLHSGASTGWNDNASIAKSRQGSLEADKTSISESLKKLSWASIRNPLHRLARSGTVKSIGSGEGSSSKGQRMTKFSGNQASKECSSCFDDVRDAISLACQHSYCKDCFSGMILSASSNEAQWPPRCCMINIPRQSIAVTLSSDSLQIYHAKEQEYSVKAGERWYCTNVPACGKFFIPKARGQDITTCLHCAHKMCTVCRAPAHERGERCASDHALEAMMQEAELEGWRQCIDCSVMVELNTGCRHITCRCGGQFCYTCGARWKTCDCTEADQSQREATLRKQREDARQRQREREEQERAERETRDEEERELQAALKAVARQQEADLAIRRRAEEEEAASLEQRRLLLIDLTFEELQKLLRRTQMEMLDAIKMRFAKELSWLQHIGESLQQLNAYEEINITNLQGKHEMELLRINERHEGENARMKQRLDEYIMKKATEGDLTGSVSPLDLVVSLRESSQNSFKEFEKIQEAKVEALKQRHAHVLEASNRSRLVTERTLLTELYNDFYGPEQMNTQEDQQEPAEVPALKQRETELAKTAICAFKWWQYIDIICTTTLADRKAHLIATGADAPAGLGVDIPEISFELPADILPHTPSVTVCENEETPAEMPGSYPVEPPKRVAPVLPSGPGRISAIGISSSWEELDRMESTDQLEMDQNSPSVIAIHPPTRPSALVPPSSARRWPQTLRGTLVTERSQRRPLF